MVPPQLPFHIFVDGSHFYDGSSLRPCDPSIQWLRVVKEGFEVKQVEVSIPAPPPMQSGISYSTALVLKNFRL